MRYLHDELAVGLPPRALLAETEDDIRRRGDESENDGVVSVFQKPEAVEIALAFRRWLLEGRRTVLLSELTVKALLDSPAPSRSEVGPLPHPVELWYEKPLSSDSWKYHPGGGKPPTPGYALGALCWEGLLGTYALPAGSAQGLEMGIGHVEQVWPDDDLELPVDARLLQAAIRALADERTHWIEPLPRTSTKARKARRSGLNIGRLVLAEDALAVWRRRHLAEHERSSPSEPVSRGPVSPHEVRPHQCRVWVLEPALGEDIEADKLHRPAKDGEPAVWLYCVSRPRRGHIHGRGEVRAKVERVVPCL